jgi:hypothetical protein
MPGLQILWIVGTILAYFGALLLDILAGILDPCLPVVGKSLLRLLAHIQQHAHAGQHHKEA